MKNIIAIYSIFKLLILSLFLLLAAIVSAQQTLCYEDGLIETYSVDIDENGGEGSTGSTYVWSIDEPSFAGTITTTSTSGNQIEINWLNTPLGTYTLTVVETDEHACPNSKELTIIIDDCQCDDPPTLLIDDVDEICSLNSINLAATITNANTILWTTNGDGTFSNDTDLTTTYTPGASDIATGTVTLSATTEDPDDDGLCEAATDDITVVINPAQTLSLPSDYALTYCEGETITFPEFEDADGNSIVGSWSPSNINNAADGTYVFTPDECYNAFTLNINVEPYDTVNFDGLPTDDVCNVSDLPNLVSLPSTSIEGYNGEWFVVDNGNNTHTYTFEVTDDGCYLTYDFTISVASEIEVTFNNLPLDDVCNVSELPNISDLPTTTNENVTGTWTRSDNGDGTYTYLFEVDPVQGCYIGTSFIVNVVPVLDVSFSNLPTENVCALIDLPNPTNLPTTSIEGITGEWVQTDNGDDSYTYTFNLDADQGCYAGITFTVTILGNEVVTFDNLPSENVCDVLELPAISDLPTSSLENITGEWSQIDNGDNSYTYTFTPDANQGCFIGTDFTVVIEDAIAVSFANLSMEDVCEISELPNIDDLPTASDEGVTGTWIVTDNDDDSYTYTFEVDPNQGCFDNYTISISIVEFEQIEIANLPLGNVCDIADLPIVSEIPVDNAEGITGVWVMTDNGDNSYTYEFIVDDGQGCYEGPSFTVIVDDNVEVSFTNLPTDSICDITELPDATELPTTSNEGVTGLWFFTDNGDNTFTYEFILDDDQVCYSGTSFTVILTPNIEVSFTNLPDNNVCNVSELPSLASLPTTSLENITGEWSQTDNGNNSYTFEFIVDDGQGCYIGTSFMVTVVDNVEVSFGDLPTTNVCNSSDLPELTSLPTTSLEGITGTWDQVDNGNNTFTYTFSLDGGQGCYIGTSFIVTIDDNIEVTFNDLPNESVCELTDLPNSSDLPTTSLEGITGSWSSIDNGDNSFTYTFTLDANQGCYTGTSFTIIYTPNQEVTFDNLPVENVCDISDIPLATDLPTTSNEGAVGVWIQVDNGDGTYTYNFILDIGQGCFLGTEFTVTVLDTIDLTFDSLPTQDVCSVSGLPFINDLPTESLENVTGEWTVTNNDDSTFTYNFNIDPDQGCYNDYSFVVTVIGIQEVSFTDLPAYDICDIADLPIVSDLPTTSLEGLTGEWTMIDNGDNSYMYFFTITGDQGCYENTTFTVNVGESIPVSFTNLPLDDVCDLADLPTLFDLPIVSNEGIEGTWSSMDNGDDTYTYEFTLDNAQDCYVGTSFTVRVNPIIQVSFNNLPTDNVCTEVDLPDATTFPTTSSEDITGSWSQIDNGDGTFTYEFNIDSDQGCYTGLSFDIIVEEDIQVSFNDLPDHDVCSLEDLPVLSNLPTTSVEGVTGIWTQTPNGDDSYTFTFTPDPGQGCYNEISFTILVAGDITVTFDDLPIDDVCNVEDLPESTELPTSSNESVTGFWTMSNNGDNTYTYSFNIDGNQGCYNSTEFTVTVLPNIEVSFADLPIEDVCDASELPAVESLPITSQEGITGTWVLTFNGVNIYKYTFILDDGQGCFVGISFIIEVMDSQEVTFADLALGNVCNISDLTDVVDLPTISEEGIEGVWTLIDNGDNTYTYNFEITADQEGCYQGLTVTVIVDNPVEVSFIDLPIDDICEESDLPIVSDLPTTSTEGVIGTWTQSNNGDGTFTYTFELDAVHDCYIGTSFTVSMMDPIATEFYYVDTFVCDVSDLPNILDLDTIDNNDVEGVWAVSVVDNVYSYEFIPNLSCYLSYTFTVTISDDIPTEFDYVSYEVCDETDLPVVNELSPLDLNAIAGTWSVSSVGMVYTYTFVPADNCYSIFEFDVTITSSADVSFVDLPSQNVCDMDELPQISELPQTSIQNVTGEWTMTDNGDNTYTYTFAPDDNCYNTYTFTVENNPPYPIEFANYLNANICSISDLPNVNNLDTTDDNGVEGTWSVNTLNNVTTYTFTPDPNCYTAFAFTYTLVDSQPTEFDYENSEVCNASDLPELNNLSATDNNGVEGIWEVENVGDDYTYTFSPNDSCYGTFDFTVSIVNQVQMDFDIQSTYCLDAPSITLPTTSNNGFEGTWSPAEIDTSAIGTFTYTFTPDDNCGAIYTIDIEITNQVLPTFDITTEYCLGESAASLPTTSDNGIEGSWSAATIDTEIAGTTQYIFTPSSDYPCAEPYLLDVEVYDLIIPVFETGLTYCLNEINPSLPTVSDNGISGYWLPNIVNTAFVGSYTHTFVVDAGQCATSYEFEISIIDCHVDDEELDIPHVITPNNDGYNDVWHVDGLERYPEASVKIYNRYNKLIFEAEGAANCDWNGYYLGRPLHTSDYWYVLDLKNGTVKTGHITVKNL